MVSFPPNSRPAGQKPTADTKRFMNQQHAFGGVQMGMHKADQEKAARKEKRKSYTQHHHNYFRSGDGRLRNSDGKWVKDPVPTAKRKPPIKPWNKGKKLGPRKKKPHGP